MTSFSFFNRHTISRCSSLKTFCFMTTYVNNITSTLFLQVSLRSWLQWRVAHRRTVVNSSQMWSLILTYIIRGCFTRKTESPWPLHFKHSHWWNKVEPVQVCFTLPLRDQRSMWMQHGHKVYMDSYVASNGSCFMVTWTISKNHFLETMAIWTLTTLDFFYFIMSEDPHE